MKTAKFGAKSKDQSLKRLREEELELITGGGQTPPLGGPTTHKGGGGGL
jgi:hypothetical protein